ncbi:hypothetical protein GCM10022215_03970 [Nocardioides fonticola]|uniref:Phage shock protein C (PspC) family protein n=1 Tax=Nocardioides fonticola TaxID=450363 RepID=A0ABP7XB95_9ACTN
MTENPTTPPPGDSAGPPPPPPSGAGEGPRVRPEDLRDLGRLRRSSADRKVAGVAGGLARHLDVDPLLLRVAFVVLVFFGGSGLLLYAAGWLLLPTDDGREAPVRLDDRSRTLALAAVGVVAALILVGGATDGPGLLWPLVVVAAIVGVVLLAKDHGLRLPGRRSAGGGSVAGTSSGTWSQPAAPGAPGVPGAPGADPSWTTSWSASWSAPDGGTGTLTAPVIVPPMPVRPDPRRTGPLLFGFTLALMAVVVGLVGVADLAGAGVTASAYPASALAVVGLMLVVAAFFGRGGGLILLGVLLVPALAATAAADSLDQDDIDLRPTTVGALPLEHDGGVGSYRLDLTGFASPTALDGRSVTISEDIGRIEIVVPAIMNVIVDAKIEGAGHVQVFDRTSDGLGPTISTGTVNDPRKALTLDLTVGIGEIEVIQR